jgi:hypothetical protein
VFSWNLLRALQIYYGYVANLYSFKCFKFPRKLAFLYYVVSPVLLSLGVCLFVCLFVSLFCIVFFSKFELIATLCFELVRLDILRIISNRN